MKRLLVMIPALAMSTLALGQPRLYYLGAKNGKVSYEKI